MISVLSGTTQNSFYIQPIRNITTVGYTTNILFYDHTNKEVVILRPTCYQQEGSKSEDNLHWRDREKSRC